MTEYLPVGCRLIPLDVHGDERGQLVAIDSQSVIPFTIARVYYVYATSPRTTRGFHAHRALRQLAVAVAGSCTMLLDDGTRQVSVRLDDPATGLTMGPMIWREMSEFSDDCVLMVLADAIYDACDYIRDYDDFRALALAGSACEAVDGASIDDERYRRRELTVHALDRPRASARLPSGEGQLNEAG